MASGYIEKRRQAWIGDSVAAHALVERWEADVRKGGKQVVTGFLFIMSGGGEVCIDIKDFPKLRKFMEGMEQVANDLKK